MEFRDRSSFTRNLPVFKKAEEILQIVHTLKEIIDPEKEQFPIVELMWSNAILIPAKIMGAEGGDLYSIRIDNAVLIKLAAVEIKGYALLLKVEGLCDENYVTLLRNTIDEFRVDFLDWVAGFDKENDIQDAWNFLIP